MSLVRKSTFVREMIPNLLYYCYFKLAPKHKIKENALTVERTLVKRKPN